MNWTYEGKEIVDISQFPENTFGFIYEVTHIPTGKKYIGKKQLFFNKKLPPLIVTGKHQLFLSLHKSNSLKHI